MATVLVEVAMMKERDVQRRSHTRTVDAHGTTAAPDLRVPGANELFIDPAWWRVIADTYGMKVDVRWTEEVEGLVSSALPTVDIDDPSGRRTVSLPFCDFVDAPMQAEDWSAFADPLIESGRRIVLDTTADHPATTDPRFETMIDGVDYVVAVDRKPSELMAGFSQLARRQIKRAARVGIRYRMATDLDSLRAYHRLHLGVRRHRHGLLAQPFSMFESIHEQFIEHGRGGVIVGELDGEVVGGCLLLVTDNAVHYKFSASAPDQRSNGVSHGAVFAALEYTNEMGRPDFDFGRSDLAHNGLVDFKRRYRPQERLLACHTAGPDLNPAFRDRLHRLTELFVDPSMPDDLTELAGNHLYRYFA